AYTRCKLALTEEEPTIRPYHEDRWAELPEAKSAPIEPSLVLLEALHRRWELALRGMAAADWERMLVHPESGRQSVAQLVALYVCPGRNHAAHARALRRREGWPYPRAGLAPACSCHRPAPCTASGARWPP